MRYLKGTLDHKLVYRRDACSDDGEIFVTYSDADHGGNPDNGKSTSGFLVTMGGAAISWSSKLQSVVTLSTTEAEYIAAVNSSKEILWLRNILQELQLPVTQSSSLFMDNNSSVQVAKNPEHHGRMKHLDLAFYQLRDVVNKKLITPIHIPTKENAADLLTKTLNNVKFSYLRKKFGLQDLLDQEGVLSITQCDM